MLRLKRFSAEISVLSNQGRKGNIKDSRVLRSKVTRRKSLKNFLLFSFLSEIMFYVGANRIANSISAKYLLASNFDFQIFSLINWQSTVLFSAIPAFEFKENIFSYNAVKIFVHLEWKWTLLQQKVNQYLGKKYPQKTGVFLWSMHRFRIADLNWKLLSAYLCIELIQTAYFKQAPCAQFSQKAGFFTRHFSTITSFYSFRFLWAFVCW